MKNFIDFIADVAKNKTMGEELKKHLDSSDHKTVSDWFKGKGYDVAEDDVKKLALNKDDIKTGSLGYFY